MNRQNLKNIKNILHHDIIFILGLGTTGQSVINFLLHLIQNHSDKKKTQNQEENTAIPQIIIIDDNLEEKSEILQQITKNFQITNNIKILDSQKFILGYNTKIDTTNKIKPKKINNNIHSHKKILITSPGIAPNHIIIQWAKKNKIHITSDIDIFYIYSKKYIRRDTQYIGVTGTNGKSSTASLIHHILQQTLVKFSPKTTSYEIVLGGNIGIPILNQLLTILQHKQQNGVNHKTKIIYVIELSSYQIDLAQHLKLDIAILLNIFPNHLARYNKISNYINAKAKIFNLLKNNNNSQKAISIINLDSSETQNIAQKLIKYQNKNNISTLLFSNQSSLPKHIIPIISQAKLYLQRSKNQIEIHQNSKKHCPSIKFTIDQKILIENYIENIIAAFACYLETIKIITKHNDDISSKINTFLEALSTFQPLKHRMEIVYKFDNNLFINDSKSTNFMALYKAFSQLTNSTIYWIAGGQKQKDINIEKSCILLIKKFLHSSCSLKKAYLIGETSEEFSKALTLNRVKNEICQDIRDALIKIKKDLQKENETNKQLTNKKLNTIILSPAFPSLDQWKNFEERGNYFTEQIKLIF